MRLFVLALVVPLVGILVSRGQASVLNISYGFTDSAIGDGTASGTILDNGNQIGTWSITGFAYTLRSHTTPAIYTPSIATVATNTPGNTYNKPGIGILISAPGLTGTRENGVLTFQYTVDWSLNAGYTLNGASFWGKYPGTVSNYGPAEPIGNGGSILLSGFTGKGVVSDPMDNLQAADGYQFDSGENFGGWNLGTSTGTLAGTVEWQLTAPTAASYTYSVNYTGQGQGLSSANEATAFNLNIVPEPSAGSLFLIGAAWVLGKRRRT